MNDRPTQVGEETQAPCPDASAAKLADLLAQDIAEQWRRGQTADVGAVLEEYPELKRHRTVVLNLAYEEFQQRLQRGEAIEAEDFARRFPSFQRSLQMLIEVHRLLSNNPDLVAQVGLIRWPELGETFLGFSLRAELGRGAFARVYLASEEALGGRLVALKVAWRGNHEAELLGKLQHPNIVPVYSVREEPETGLTAVCMPYLGRTTLADVLDRVFAGSRSPVQARAFWETVEQMNREPKLPGPVGFDRALRRGIYLDGVVHLAAQLCEALAFTHAKGICHRDLKPSNVLISLEGRPLLLDFNVSSDEQVDADRVGGTLPYMAPEQLRLLSKPSQPGRTAPDARADLFSFGVILYELLTGALPFGPLPHATSLEEMACLLLERQKRGLIPLRARDRCLDASVASCIERCLAFEPEGRPQTATELLAGLREGQRWIRRARRWVRRHPRLMASMLGLSLLGTSALGSHLALRDPYPIRQLEQGQEYLAQGDYGLAAECFDRALRAEPELSAARFARGRAHQLQGNFLAAMEDYRVAYRQEPSAHTAAALGYCLAECKYHKEAAEFFQQALDRGFRSPGVLNDLAFALLQTGRFDQAEPYLQEAIREDANLQPAYRNLAVVKLNQAMAGRDTAAEGLRYALLALSIGPPAADLYQLAARLHLLQGSPQAEAAASAITCLEKGVALGLNARSVQADPAFVTLREDPRFQALAQIVADTETRPRGEYLVDPLPKGF